MTSKPVGTMFDRGIHFTIGWVNARPNIPHVLDLLAHRDINVEPIHTVAPWDSATETIPVGHTKLNSAAKEPQREPPHFGLPAADRKDRNMTSHPDLRQTNYSASNPRVNGLAVASLVLGIVWLMWVGSVLALVFGYIARNQIDRTSGAETGRGMAIAGIVLGWVGVGTLVLMVTLMISGVFTMPDMPMMNRPDVSEGFTSNGERIFRTATNNSGETIGYEQGPGDGMMSGMLACADCHGTDGQGGERQMMMETFYAPDIRWSTLEGRYTTETVRSAITQGVGSGGRPLSPIMPRWQLSDTDLDDLIEYLQTLE